MINKEYNIPEEYSFPADSSVDMDAEFNTSPRRRNALPEKKGTQRRFLRHKAAMLLAAFTSVYVFMPMYDIPMFQESGEAAVSIPPPMAEVQTSYEGTATFDYEYELAGTARHQVYHFSNHITYYYHTPDGEKEEVYLGSFGLGTDIDGEKLGPFFEERGLDVTQARKYFSSGDNYMSYTIEDKSGKVIQPDELPDGYSIREYAPSILAGWAEERSGQQDAHENASHLYYMNLLVDDEDQSIYQLIDTPYELHIYDNRQMYYILPRTGERYEHPDTSDWCSEYDDSYGSEENGYAGLESVDRNSVDLDKKQFGIKVTPSPMVRDFGNGAECLYDLSYEIHFDRSEVPGLKFPDNPASIDPKLPMKEQLAKMAETYGIEPGRLRLHSDTTLSDAYTVLEGSVYTGDPLGDDLNVEKGKITFYRAGTIHLVLAPEGSTDSAEVSDYEGRLEFQMNYGGSQYAVYDSTMNEPFRHFVYYYHTPDGQPENIDLGALGTDWDNVVEYHLKSFFDERGLDVNDAYQFFFNGDNYMSCLAAKEDGFGFDEIKFSELPDGYYVTDSLPENVRFDRDRTEADYGDRSADDKSYYMSLRIDNNEIFDDNVTEGEDGWAYRPYLLGAVTTTYSYYVVPNPGEEPVRPDPPGSWNEYDPNCGGAEAGYAELQSAANDGIDLDSKFFTLTLRPSTMVEKISDTEETLHYIVYYVYFDRSEVPGLKLPYRERENASSVLIKVNPSLSLKEQLEKMAQAYGIDPSRLRFHSEKLGTMTAGFLDGASYITNTTDRLLEYDAETGKKINYRMHKIRLVLAPAG
ncbi:MAG: hypothetical protein IKO47_06210 [Ruminococcus sp.]|nr:hypothetical protein [Ruminococcus sp.]